MAEGMEACPVCGGYIGSGDRARECRACNYRPSPVTPTPPVAERLLPCPFCGERGAAAKITTATKFVGHVVICTGCETRTNMCVDAERAIAAWNRRTPDEAATELLSLRAERDEARREKDFAVDKANEYSLALDGRQKELTAARKALEHAKALGVTLREGNMMLDNEPPLFVAGYEKACADFSFSLEIAAQPGETR